MAPQHVPSSWTNSKRVGPKVQQNNTCEGDHEANMKQYMTKKNMEQTELHKDCWPICWAKFHRNFLSQLGLTLVSDLRMCVGNLLLIGCLPLLLQNADGLKTGRRPLDNIYIYVCVYMYICLYTDFIIYCNAMQYTAMCVYVYPYR